MPSLRRWSLGCRAGPTRDSSFPAGGIFPPLLGPVAAYHEQLDWFNSDRAATGFGGTTDSLRRYLAPSPPCYNSRSGRRLNQVGRALSLWHEIVLRTMDLFPTDCPRPPGGGHATRPDSTSFARRSGQGG